MITKNNIIIFSLIIVVAFICFFLKGQLTSNDTLTTPITNSNIEASQQNQKQNSDIYIDC